MGRGRTVLHHGILGQAKAVAEWNVEQLGLAMTGSTSATIAMVAKAV